jgi:hypothetical protein
MAAQKLSGPPHEIIRNTFYLSQVLPVGLISLISLFAQSFSRMKVPVRGACLSFLSQSAFFFWKALRSQEREGRFRNLQKL